MTSFQLNGQSVSVSESHPHLLGALRDELGVISAKDGCAPSGQCGACTVLVGDKARVACQTSLERTDGETVTTLEGFDELELQRYCDIFAAHGALQCGFCIPGILVRSKALIEKKGQALTRDETARHLGAHLCRCTGYIKILDAILDIASGVNREPQPPKGVGSRGTKYEADVLAAGVRPFIDDMQVDGLLHGALRLSDHARADVIAIDVEAALSVEGVAGIFTAADIPGEIRVGLIHKDWPVMIPVGGRTSFLGDVLAVVVADDRMTAVEAAALVQVEYRVHQPMTDPVRVVDSDEDAVWGLEGNILSKSVYQRGDVDSVLEQSAHVVSETFQTQRVEHAFLEPESTLAVPTDGGLYVYTGGQGIWDDRNDIARVLDLDPSLITTELVSNGGAFGGKEDMSNQVHTALSAWLLGKPVQITLSREQSLLMHPKRHPIRMTYEAGCDENGKLTGLRARMLGDSGPYASVGMKVLERAAGHATGPYVLQAVDVEAVAARTNNPVCGAFRGFGANQAQFAMEGIIDRLAEKVGINGWEIRSLNVVNPGDVWGPGQIMDDGCLGARACLDAVKPAYDQAIQDGLPVGIGLGLKNSGLGNGFDEIAKAVVRFEADGTIEVRHCWTEMGQGVHNVALQVAVEELGVAAEQIKVIVDSTRELGAGQTTGSRGTLMGAGAVQDACRNALLDGCQVGLDYEGSYRINWTNSLSEGLENPVIHSTFGYASQLVVLNPDDGEVRNVVAAHDVGRAVNPMLCEGQIEGAVHMGLGYALTEGFPTDSSGRPTNTTFRSLDIIRPKDMPPVDVIIIESPQPGSPYGIKGVGEIGLVPTAGAVAAAVRSYDDSWPTELPIRNLANRERADAWT
tara:strand:- start:29732 stop:32305 length:2574 start_codon:yes stop_codon:yes gene_type:complete